MQHTLNWYFSAVSDGETITPFSITNDAGIGVYRQDDGSNEVSVTVGDETHRLGIRDASVSRMRDDGAPVRISRDEDAVEIWNFDNVGDITVSAPGKYIELGKGDRTSISNDCMIEVGYNTELLLTSEIEQAETESKKTSVLKEDGEITVNAYVGLHCHHFELKSQESVSEALQCGRGLHRVLKDYPVDATGYDELRNRLGRLIEQLEVEDPNDELSEERISRHKEIAGEIEQLYSRS
jgi:hypothetical protein